MLALFIRFCCMGYLHLFYNDLYALSAGVPNSRPPVVFSNIRMPRLTHKTTFLSNKIFWILMLTEKTLIYCKLWSNNNLTKTEFFFSF